MKKLFYYAHLPVLGLSLMGMILHFSFTAEDAYITYRYAENLIHLGSLVFNPGEPINAMTSPLHALLSSVLFIVTGQTVLSNRLLALLLLLLSALLVWYRFRSQPHWQLLVLILLLLPPSILLWTFGGLETPLLLFWTTLAVFLADRATPFSGNRLRVVFFLAGLAFLTRYDSLLFFIPLLFHAGSKARSLKAVVMALPGASLPPAAWLATSLVYYGDLLPTSFYVKAPNLGFSSLIYNGLYITSYLVFVGVIPTCVLALVPLRTGANIRELLTGHLKRRWWLYVGLGLELAYGLTIATHHMMFSFRFFVPYLPATTLLVVDFSRRASETRDYDFASGRAARLMVSYLACLALFQAYQLVYSYESSMNGLSAIGEYRSVGVRDYLRFTGILKREAVDIETHWAQRSVEARRRPRILTYAAGMLPYTFRESYIYEKLVSYRRCFVAQPGRGLFADYLHIVVPRHGSVDQQLPGPESDFVLVSSYEMLFDGAREAFLVYYNPDPQAHNLGLTINQDCPEGD